MPTDATHRQDLELALALADLAAGISLPSFHARSFTTEYKPDGSPVTSADVAVETALRRELADRRPGDMVVGEEGGRSGDSRRCWYLDPIDGTTRFVAGDPEWMTLIALGEGDQITVGVVDLPARGERWWASAGGGAFHDGARVSVSGRRPLAEAVVTDTWRRDLARDNRDHPLWTVAQRAGRVRPHQGHGVLAVACGEADVAVQLGGFAWDYAPLKAIVEEAGGAFTDLAGGLGIDSGGIVATNGLLHHEVLALIGAERSA